ncbi:MAG TPA: ABC transporter ATP-binding protein, partial [Caulobacterales bacterium]|nr:ABC transporter ATP-binding protein [Caulobacterales bacterium]
EAERCSHVVVLHEGRALAQGRPETVSALAQGRVFLVDAPAGMAPRNLQARLLDAPGTIDAAPEPGRVRLIGAGAGAPIEGLSLSPTAARFEDGFMVLLGQAKAAAGGARAVSLEAPVPIRDGRAAVEVRDLVRRFGAFTAVDHISFDVGRGELFGLLGPNGAGKTTTFRMLCGLLPVTSGSLHVAGADLRTARAAARQHIGYVAQKFSLYGELSALENLDFFASAYNLRGARKRERIEWAIEQFELAPVKDLRGGQLPGGFKQRLAMAAALLHQPEILFLDEPTSGADPLARREFWRRITALAEQGVTVIITTHFLDEAEYCDRVAVLDQGRLLAQGAPGELRAFAPKIEGREARMEDAFIAIVEQARREASGHAA